MAPERDSQQQHSLSPSSLNDSSQKDREVVLFAIGSELVQGKGVDSNSAWLAEELAKLGLRVRRICVLPDSQDEIHRALRQAWDEECSIIVGGGLGPTSDDKTREVCAALFGGNLELSDAALKKSLARYRMAGLEPNPGVEKQSSVPSGCEVIINNHGSAHAFARWESARFLVALPGVPREMRGIWKDQIEGEIRTRYAASAVYTRTLHLCGDYESKVQECLEEELSESDGIDASILVSDLVLTLRWQTLLADKHEEVNAIVSRAESKLGELVFARDFKTIEGINSLASRVIELAKQNRARVSVAESVTGGLIAKLLTDVPGASAVLEAGIVSYSESIKTGVLGVPREILSDQGVYSAECVSTMAEGAIRLSRAQGSDEAREVEIAIATSGIASPTDNPEDELGSVWFGLAIMRDDSLVTNTYRYRFPGSRDVIRRYAALTALNLVRLALESDPIEAPEPAPRAFLRQSPN